MQPTHTQNPAQPYALLFDGECPLCRLGVAQYEMEPKEGTLACVDARAPSALKQEVLAAGMNPDEGMVFSENGKLYHGSDALRRLAVLGRRDTLKGFLSYWLFRWCTVSRALYPLMTGARRVLLKMRGVPDILEADEKKTATTIQRQLGSDWEHLHPNVRARFAKEPRVGGEILYRGVMSRIECSRAGRLFAHLTRIINNPLTPFTGVNVPMDVRLHRMHGRDGIYWRRTYYYPEQPPYMVTSVKREARGRQMQECVGGGFGMRLKVYAQGGSLHFESTRYFWQLGGLNVPLPDILSPGKTHVIHEDLNDGTFRFTIAMDHPLLGRTFYQEGIFREV